jgi:hypothetical protein
LLRSHRYASTHCQPCIPAPGFRYFKFILTPVWGDKDEKVKASLKDAELLQQFKAVEQFTDEDKTIVKKLIDAFIIKKQLQQMAS